MNKLDPVFVQHQGIWFPSLPREAGWVEARERTTPVIPNPKTEFQGGSVSQSSIDGETNIPDCGLLEYNI